jgi:hypothetical protein
MRGEKNKDCRVRISELSAKFLRWCRWFGFKSPTAAFPEHAGNDGPSEKKGGHMMKERFLDVVKWGLILVIAGGVFYQTFSLTYPNTYPKFEFFKGGGELQWYRCNKITGEIERWQSPEIQMEYGEWEPLGPLTAEERRKRVKAERERNAIDLMESFWGRGRSISELEENYRNDLQEAKRKQARLEETLLMMDRVDAELAAEQEEAQKSGSIQSESR